MFEKIIYKRYLFAKRKFQFISLINKLSIVGIIIGVASLIIIMSIFNGFRDFTIFELVRDNPHLVISKYNDELKDNLNKNKDIQSVTEVYTNEIIIEQNKKRISSTIVISESFENNIISNKIANELDAFLGDTLKILSMTQVESLVSSLSILKPKIFIADNVAYNSSMTIKSNDLKLKQPGAIKELHLRLSDFMNADEFKENLTKSYNFKNNPEKNKLEIISWKDKNKLLIVVMEIERYFVFVVLFIVVIIASFNLFASISMTIFEKNKDIGILRTIGSTKKNIQKIFITQGNIAGLIGLFLGTIIGLSVVYSQLYFSWINIHVSNGMSHPLPMEFQLLDLISIIISTVLIIFISTYFPAKLSSNKSIADGIKVNN